MDMKLRYLLYAMLAGVTCGSLSGCSADEERSGIGGTTPLAIRSMSVGTYSSDVDTRAGGDLVILKEGTIGVFRISGGEEKLNVPYVYGETAWTTTQEGILLSKEVSQLCTYYPYSSSDDTFEKTSDDISLSLQIAPYSKANDLCGGTFTASETNSRPTPVLSHLYARISFRFAKQDTYKEKGVVCSFMLNGVYKAGKYCLFADSYSVTDTGSYIWNSPDVTAGTEHSTVDLLLIPMNIPSGGQEFLFYLDGTEKKNSYKGTIPQSLFTSTNNSLQAGYHYKLKVMVGEKGFTVVPDDDNGPSVSGWSTEKLKDNEVEVG